MKKLGTSETKTLNAVNALIRLYRKQPDFKNEFNSICELYKLQIDYFCFQWISNHKSVVISGLKDPAEYNKITGKLCSAPMQEKDLNPDPCFQALNELAWQWQFRLPDHLAGLNLFMYKVAERFKELGIDTIQTSSRFHPDYSGATGELKIEIQDWEIVEIGQEELVKQFRKQLAEHVKEVRKKGITDSPSSLETHALWWFKNNVLGTKYDDIAQQEAYTPGGSMISYARNVGTAVRSFSKLLGIKPKDR